MNPPPARDDGTHGHGGAVRLTLVCHASTPATRTASFPADEPLDDRVRRALDARSYRLPPADRRWTSPALRAVQTAEALRLDATPEPLLRDCDYGQWTGRSLDEVGTDDPEAMAVWLRDSSAAPHGGESIIDLLERVASWVDRQGETPGRTVAVTHAGVIRAAVVHAIEATPRSFWRIDVPPLSVTRLNGSHGRWTLSSISLLPKS